MSMTASYQNADDSSPRYDIDVETSFSMSATESEAIGQHSTQPTIVVPDRPAFNQVEFNANYQLITPQHSGLKERLETLQQKCFTTAFWWSFAKSRLPILVWLPKYKWKDDILNDIIAGITVAIMHISLGMAFATLALMPPITGLYIAFFSNLLYTFIGSAHHLALCGTAVISIMIGEVVQRLLHPPNPSIPFTTFSVVKNGSVAKLSPTAGAAVTSLLPNTVALNPYEGVTAVDIAIAITLVVGIIHMITGILRLGGLSVYLSDTMLSGFLFGTTCHVFTSQLATLFGVTIPQIGSPLKVFKIIIAVCGQFPHANVPTVVTSISTIVLLVLTKYLSGRYLKVVPFTIPLELVAILVGTLVSYCMDFEGEYKVAIVGYIQTGLPTPVVPALWIIPSVLLDSFIICIVAYTITLSFGLVFAKKYGFKVDSNQELLALGLINICGSFFQCIPSSVGMSRTMAQEEAGSRTLLTNFISSIILLFAILFIGPVFHDLPMCILAAIVVIALTGMLTELLHLRRAWTISIVEASLWIVAFIAVVTLDVGIGLGIGFLYSLVVTVVRTQWPETFLLGKIPETDIYLEITKYQAAEEIPGIKIYHFASFLYFVNKDYFVSELNRLIEFDSIRPGGNMFPRFRTSSPLRRETMLLVPKNKESPSYGSTLMEPNISQSITTTLTAPSPRCSVTAVPIHHVIIDASGWSYIDLPGIEALNQVVEDYKKKGITIFIAGCQVQVSEKLVQSEFYLRGNKHLIFPTIQDAMAYAELEGRDLMTDYSSQIDV